MKHCTNCGAQIPDGTKFCPECGQPIPAEPAFTAPQPSEPPVQQTYEPPVQQTYEPPVQQTYQAPAQTYQAPAQSYQAPTQTYAPPTQSGGGGSYVPPAAPPKAPKEKKPMSKGLLFGILGVAVVALIAIVIALAGGGKGKDDPNLGRYNGVSCVYAGIELGADGEWIELKSKGKATLSVMDSEFACEWSLDGETFTLKQSGDSYTGTLKDGVLTVDMEGMVYTFAKEGAAVPETADGAEVTPEAASEAGYWTLLRVDATGDDAMSEEDLATFRDLGIEFFLTLEEDGTGALVFDGPVHVTWGDGKLNIEGEGAYPYSLDGGELHLDIDGSNYIFTRGEGAAPAIDWSGAEEPEEPEEPEAPEEPGEPAAAFEPVTGTVSGCTVTISGAELFADSDGKDAIRVYWDFTNDTGDTTYPSYDISCTVEQEGFELNTTYASYEDDVPEYGNDSLSLRPGMTIRCIAEYACKADGDVITFTLHNWSDESECVTATLDPKNLPGRPGELPAVTIDEPAWTNEMSDEGDVNGAHVYIDTAEVVDSDDGGQVIRVYFDYTNLGDEASSMWWSVYTRAFQDGIELKSGWPDEDVPEDDNYTVDVEPGDSLTCSLCWTLRTGSPVEIEVYNAWNDEYVGCYFTLN